MFNHLIRWKSAYIKVAITNIGLKVSLVNYRQVIIVKQTNFVNVHLDSDQVGYVSVWILCLYKNNEINKSFRGLNLNFCEQI